MNGAYEYYKSLTEADIPKCMQSGKIMQNYIEHSEAVYHGILVRSLYIPKIFTEDMTRLFSELTKTLYGILCKVISRYENNAEYRSLFGFDKRLERLILRPDMYPSKIPMARVDIFFNEDDFSFKFCEFNADGASAMNEDRELNNALTLSHTYKKFKKRYDITTYELFKSWVREFIRLYSQSPFSEERPSIAIVDFLPEDVNYEFVRFSNTFNEMGYPCMVCDIRGLSYDGKYLYAPNGTRINAVYRRAVTCDIMAAYDEVQPFINAVADNNVLLIGDFKTQVIHDKIIFKILHDSATKNFLTDEENAFIEEHIPKTYILTDDSIREHDVLLRRNDWIIKPRDSYASKGFHAGVECKSDSEWKALVLENANGDYLLQEYVKPYEISNIDLLHGSDAEFHNYSSITGLFVYNGRFSGIYSRIAKTSIISTQYSEMSLPSIVAAER